MWAITLELMLVISLCSTIIVLLKLFIFIFQIYIPHYRHLDSFSHIESCHISYHILQY